MKNEKLYDDYAIHGFPNVFYSVEAAYRYNDWVCKQCNRLPEGTEDFPLLTKILGRLYYNNYLMAADFVFYFFEEREREKERRRNSKKAKGEEECT